MPISIGGQSDPAFQVGGAKADIFSFWGEPLAELSSEIGRVNAIARAAGRTTVPRFWVTFRPIIAPTDQLAWEKAHDYIGRIESTFQAGTFHRGQRPARRRTSARSGRWRSRARPSSTTARCGPRPPR